MKNLSIKILIIASIILFVFIANIIIKSTSTLTAVVPNREIKEGTVITEDMLKEITISANVPKGYITDKASLIGQKLRINVMENQLIYISNIMTSWEELLDGEDIPENYVITSIFVPAERAIGGLISAGDVVDILGVPNSEYIHESKENMRMYLGEEVVDNDSYGTEYGINIYWVLSNVKILQTDSALSTIEDPTISMITDLNKGSNKGSYYIIALSYADLQKLRLFECYLDFWLSLVPKANEDSSPLYDQMRQKIIKKMVDSQNQDLDYILRKRIEP